MLETLQEKQTAMRIRQSKRIKLFPPSTNRYLQCLFNLLALVGVYQ